MTKGDRIIRYLDLASMPENIPYNTSRFMTELNITNDDIDAYRRKMISEQSLKSTVKRDIVVKQVIKPLLKKHGFSTSGLDWHRELEDGYLIIHMMNSHFNGPGIGVSFRFHISAVKKDKIKDKLSHQWMFNQFQDLTQFSFLPYCGMLSPYYSGDMYQIDGYKNYFPVDTPAEEICRQISEDFGVYILPELSAVQTYENFITLRDQKRKRYDEKEIRLLRYYHAAQCCAVELSGRGYDRLVEMKRELQLSTEDIVAHLEWLDVIRNNFRFSKVDAKELAIKAAKEQNG